MIPRPHPRTIVSEFLGGETQASLLIKTFPGGLLCAAKVENHCTLPGGYTSIHGLQAKGGGGSEKFGDLSKLTEE